MKSSLQRVCSAALLLLAGTVQILAAPAMPKVMLLTGQSSRYHDWTKSSPLIKRYLDETGLFTVDVVTTPPTGADMGGFAPTFDGYAAVVVDYEGAEWPAATKQAFVAYMKNGGGLVVIHASDNAFPFWPEWNEMIGVGGWGLKADGTIGARNESWGPKVRWRDGHFVLDSTTPGNAGHPARHDFAVITRAPGHPVMHGLPEIWTQAADEIYSQLRGPAKNLEVLATALADKTKFPNASGEHEPVLMAIAYGRGRVFHTTLGHVGPKDQAPFLPLVSVAFIVTLQRGTEWAATGRVTQALPADFPAAGQTSLRTH